MLLFRWALWYEAHPPIFAFTAPLQQAVCQQPHLTGEGVALQRCYTLPQLVVSSQWWLQSWNPGLLSFNPRQCLLRGLFSFP